MIILIFVVISCVSLGPHDSLLWAFRYAESLTTQLGNVGHMVGQVHATEYAYDAIKFLKSGNWTQNDQMSLDEL